MKFTPLHMCTFLINGESDVKEELPEDGRRDSVVDGEHSLGSEYSDRSPHHPNLLLSCGLHEEHIRENLVTIFQFQRVGKQKK